MFGLFKKDAPSKESGQVSTQGQPIHITPLRDTAKILRVLTRIRNCRLALEKPNLITERRNAISEEITDSIMLLRISKIEVPNTIEGLNEMIGKYNHG